MTSVAKDRIRVRHQPFNKIIIIQIIGCKYFLSYSLNYLNIIVCFFLYLSIIIYFYSFNFWFLYNYTPYDLYYYDFVEWLVSDADTSCAPGVICFFVHYSLNVSQTMLRQPIEGQQWFQTKIQVYELCSLSNYNSNIPYSHAKSSSITRQIILKQKSDRLFNNNPSIELQFFLV